MKTLLFSFLMVFYVRIANYELDHDIYRAALLEALKFEKPEKGVFYVEKNSYMVSNWPLNLESNKIFYLNADDVIKLINKESVIIYRVVPAIIENSSLKINVIKLRIVKSGKKSFNYVNEGGISMFYIYNCNESEFKILKTEKY